MFDYNLRFENQEEANDFLNPILDALHPSEYVRYDVGQIKSYEYDETDWEKPPVVKVIDARHHIDIRLRAENKALEKYQVFPENPVHQFS